MGLSNEGCYDHRDKNLLIMDEPFNGLDEGAIEEVKKICNELRKTQFTTILVSSHQLNELEEFCDKFLLIQKGKIHSSNSTLRNSRNIKLITDSVLPKPTYDKLSSFGNIKLAHDREYEIELYENAESTNIIEFLVAENVIFKEIYYVKKSVFMESK